MCVSAWHACVERRMCRDLARKRHQCQRSVCGSTRNTQHTRHRKGKLCRRRRRRWLALVGWLQSARKCFNMCPRCAHVIDYIIGLFARCWCRVAARCDVCCCAEQGDRKSAQLVIRAHLANANTAAAYFMRVIVVACSVCVVLCGVWDGIYNTHN